MKVDLNLEQKEQLAETFGLLSDPTRLSVVLACSKGDISAGDIAQEVGSSPSLVSHHLRLLKAAHMVRAERRGKHIFYSLADECVRDVLKIMTNHVFAHGH